MLIKKLPASIGVYAFCNERHQTSRINLKPFNSLFVLQQSKFSISMISEGEDQYSETPVDDNMDCTFPIMLQS